MSAAGVSRVIKSECGRTVRQLVMLMQSSYGDTIVYTPNGARHQAAALSAARRALIRRGYGVVTMRGKSHLPLGPHTFYLRVSGKAARP